MREKEEWTEKEKRRNKKRKGVRKGGKGKENREP